MATKRKGRTLLQEQSIGDNIDTSHVEQHNEVWQSSSNTSVKKKVRGETRNLKILEEYRNKKIPVEFKMSKPVNENAQYFITQLGVLLKNTSNVPLDVPTWDCIEKSKRDKIWTLVKEMFDVKEEDKETIMDLCRERYRNRKYKLKAKYFSDESAQTRPSSIPEEQWKWLISHWSSEDFKKMSARNVKNRSQVEMGHTSGTKSYMRIKVDEEKLKGKKLSAREFFVMTHKKKDGSWVDTTVENVMAKYDHEVTSKLSEGESTSINEEEIFSQALGLKKFAHLQRYGATQKATKKEEMKKMREDMKSEMEERLNKVTAHYEAKCDALQAKCEDMQIMLEQVMRQMNCSSSSRPYEHSPQSFENEFEDLC